MHAWMSNLFQFWCHICSDCCHICNFDVIFVVIVMWLWCPVCSDCNVSIVILQAAGRHQCSYLIHIQSNEFLLQGGDERWLKGLDFIPQKLRDLYEVNRILAHRPWLLGKHHIEVYNEFQSDEAIHMIYFQFSLWILQIYIFNNMWNNSL